MPLAVLKVDVEGEYGEAIIFHSKLAQICPAELSNQLGLVVLSCMHTHSLTFSHLDNSIAQPKLEILLSALLNILF